MLKKIAESSVIFISVLKWIVLATLIGVIVGFSTSVFLKLLNWSTDLSGKIPFFFMTMPVAFFLSALLVKYLAPDAEGHGTEKVIEAVHKEAGRIKPAVVPVKLAATIVTLASGGSAGKEGPCAQIGAGLASIFAGLLKFTDSDRRKLVICGISAGFASVFGTPIAGALFGVEVLFVGSILYEVLLPSFIAGITSYQVSYSLGIRYFHHAIDFMPVFSEAFFLKVVLAGVFFGIISLVMIEILRSGERLSKKINIWPPLKGLIGGAALVMLTMFFSREYLGLGLESIEACLAGHATVPYAFLLKTLFTTITLNFGGSGGIVTPIFFIGAASGTLFAALMGLNVGTFSAIGLVALLAGAANTPIAASIMAVELYGPKIAPYATVACVISFLITGHRSVYPSQILSIKKSPAINVELGKQMEDVEVDIQPRPTGLIKTSKKVVDRIGRYRPHRKKKSPPPSTPTA